MTITAALVLFAMIWFVCLFVALPLRLTSQGEAGEVVPGTPSSAPVATGLARKVRIVTVVAIVLWALAAGTIWSGVISVRDIDLFNRMSPAGEADERGG